MMTPARAKFWQDKEIVEYLLSRGTLADIFEVREEAGKKIKVIGTFVKELDMVEMPKKLTVERWICPLCEKEKTTVIIDDGVEYGGNFWRGDGIEGCLDCWPGYC